MINAIQVILLSGIVLLAIYAYRKLRSSNLDAILIILFFATGVFFVLFPDTTTKIAHWAGVGRGVDMLFYLSILFFGFLIIKLYTKLRKLEQEVTSIVRKESIDNATSNSAKDS